MNESFRYRCCHRTSISKLTNSNFTHQNNRYRNFDIDKMNVKFQNWFQIVDTCNIHREIFSFSTKSRNFEKFTSSKISKIRIESDTNSNWFNLISFHFHFLRRFQNWFQNFDTCNIHRETTRVPKKSRNFEKFSTRKLSKVRIKSVTNPIRLSFTSFQLHFLRRFQNWFQNFDTCNIRRETTRISTKFQIVEIRAK